MKSKTGSILACLVVSCAMCGAFSGCSQPDSPPPAKPTEAVAAPTAEELKPRKDKAGKEYGASSKYKDMMEKRFKPQ